MVKSGRQSKADRGPGDQGVERQWSLQYPRGKYQRLDYGRKVADYVVLADDLHKIDPEKIKDVKIVQTVVGGITRYQA